MAQPASNRGGGELRAAGYRGARLGEPYEYRWVDQEPTRKTWADLAERKGCLWAVVAVPIWTYGGWVLGGPTGFGFGLLLAFWTFPIALEMGAEAAGRRDKEPVPRAVRREAYIEFADNDFHFVLEVDGKPFIWQPWSLVQQFEKTAYWPMFGDAGESPYKTGWHAIAMTPDTGSPWLIASTIEGEAAVRERFTALDARFGPASRAAFMRAYEARQRANQPKTSVDESRASGSRGDGIPKEL